MTTADIIQAENTCLLPTYSKLPLALLRGEGAYVWDAEGRKYLDFYGGHCVTLLGHCPPTVVHAVQQQAATLLFYSNVVYNDVRARAAARLAEAAPDGLGNIFFCNSGSEAVETALKIARKATGHDGIVAMEGDFHGRTLGSLATTWNNRYRAPYHGILPHTEFVPFGNLGAVRHALEKLPGTAAVLLEPIQSIAGMVEAPVAFYQGLRTLCDATGTLLIFDEVQTGVGRTGTFSVAEQYGITPDLITLAKSLGAGIPVGATLVRDALVSGVQTGDQGSTFGGGMLAMAAVEATLAAVCDGNLMPRAGELFRRIVSIASPHFRAVRGRGCLIGLDFGKPCALLLAALREHGVLAGASNDPHVIRLMPPLIAGDNELAFFSTALQAALSSLKQHAY